jgi:hypothetical protein
MDGERQQPPGPDQGPQLDREEFHTFMLDRLRMTRAEWTAAGFVIEPCSCGEEYCQGWVIASEPLNCWRARLGAWSRREGTEL